MIRAEIQQIYEHLQKAYPNYRVELEDPADFEAQPELGFYPDQESGSVTIMLDSKWGWPGANRDYGIIGVLVFIDDEKFVVDNEWLMFDDRIAIDDIDLVYLKIDEIMNMYENPTPETVKMLLDKVHSLNSELINYRLSDES